MAESILSYLHLQYKSLALVDFKKNKNKESATISIDDDENPIDISSPDTEINMEDTSTLVAVFRLIGETKLPVLQVSGFRQTSFLRSFLRIIIRSLAEQPYKNISERTIAETAKSTASTNV